MRRSLGTPEHAEPLSNSGFRAPLPAVSPGGRLLLHQPGRRRLQLFPWPKETWDGNGDWTGRKPGQPFFCTFNSDDDARVLPAQVACASGFLAEKFTLPPYHPDTPEIRSNWVEYYHDMDQDGRRCSARCESAWKSKAWRTTQSSSTFLTMAEYCRAASDFSLTPDCTFR